MDYLNVTFSPLTLIGLIHLVSPAPYFWKKKKRKLKSIRLKSVLSLFLLRSHTKHINCKPFIGFFFILAFIYDDDDDDNDDFELIFKETFSYVTSGSIANFHTFLTHKNVINMTVLVLQCWHLPLSLGGANTTISWKGNSMTSPQLFLLDVSIGKLFSAYSTVPSSFLNHLKWCSSLRMGKYKGDCSG